jgi:hypothetical protein
MNLEKIITSIFVSIIALFIIFTFVSSFAKINPTFSVFGWIIFIFVLIAVILGIYGVIRELF